MYAFNFFIFSQIFSPRLLISDANITFERMELLKWRNKSGIAKVAGIIFCTGGVAVLAFYKGPGFQIIPLKNQLVSTRRIAQEAHHSAVTWLKGCFSLVACSFFFASWIVFQVS